jgi:DNA polymerase-3 subunit epsilon
MLEGRWQARTDGARRWARSLLGTAWCVLDTETTGLGAGAEVVQIAVVDGQSGNVLFDRDVRPAGARFETRAQAVNRLDAGRLAAASRWPDVYYALCPVLTGRRVVAYNADFDRRLLDQTCDRYRLPRLRLRWECAMARYTAWSGRWRALRFACAVEDVAVDVGELHSAAGDALATWHLVQVMVDRGVPLLREGGG